MDNIEKNLETRLSKLEDAVFYIKNAIDSIIKQTVDQCRPETFTDSGAVKTNYTEQQQTPLGEQRTEDENSRGLIEKTLIDVDSETKSIEENKELETVTTDENNELPKVTKEPNDLTSRFESRSHDQTQNSFIHHTLRLETSIMNYTNLIRQMIKLDKGEGFYENWEANHQRLLTAVYVSQPVFLEALWRLQFVIQLQYLAREVMDRILDSLPMHAVTRTSRFPEYGLYLNVNDYDLYKCIQYMRDCMSNPKGNNTAELKQTLNALQNMALTAVDDPMWKGMANDLVSFEKENELRWVDNPLL